MTPSNYLRVLFVINLSCQEAALFKIAWSNGLIPRLFGLKGFIIPGVPLGVPKKCIYMICIQTFAFGIY